jgi:hypothetical protein
VININDDNLFKKNFLFYEKRLKPNGTFETYLEINENNQDHTIKWSILKHAISYTGGIKRLQFMFGRKILHFERHKQR